MPMVPFLLVKAAASLPAVSVATLLGSAPTLAADVSEIELRRLFEPNKAELAEESKGRIHIYEGLRDTDVQRALDEEFGRVENMMFIRTIKTDEEGKVERDPETGEVEVEDDGC
jgi:hypothetical protein